MFEMTASARRTWLLGGMMIAVLMAGSSYGGHGPAERKEETTPRLVVFVCEHGSAKSLVAASFFERLAKERGMAVRAVSRGTAPDASVPATVVEALRGDGFDVAAFKPQALKEADVLAADRLVAIGVDLGEVGAKARTGIVRWDDIPPFSASYPRARAAILSRIKSLLGDLERRRPDR
jgi:arsenate reductase